MALIQGTSMYIFLLILTNLSSTISGRLHRMGDPGYVSLDGAKDKQHAVYKKWPLTEDSFPPLQPVKSSHQLNAFDDSFSIRRKLSDAISANWGRRHRIGNDKFASFSVDLDGKVAHPEIGPHPTLTALSHGQNFLVRNRSENGGRQETTRGKFWRESPGKFAEEEYSKDIKRKDGIEMRGQLTGRGIPTQDQSSYGWVLLNNFPDSVISDYQLSANVIVKNVTDLSLCLTSESDRIDPPRLESVTGFSIFACFKGLLTTRREEVGAVDADEMKQDEMAPGDLPIPTDEDLLSTAPNNQMIHNQDDSLRLIRFWHLPHVDETLLNPHVTVRIRANPLLMPNGKILVEPKMDLTLTDFPRRLQALPLNASRAGLGGGGVVFATDDVLPCGESIGSALASIKKAMEGPRSTSEFACVRSLMDKLVNNGGDREEGGGVMLHALPRPLICSLVGDVSRCLARHVTETKSVPKGREQDKKKKHNKAKNNLQSKNIPVHSLGEMLGRESERLEDEDIYREEVQKKLGIWSKWANELLF